jgi:hypothetical protein
VTGAHSRGASAQASFFLSPRARAGLPVPHTTHHSLNSVFRFVYGTRAGAVHVSPRFSPTICVCVIPFGLPAMEDVTCEAAAFMIMIVFRLETARKAPLLPPTS